MTAAAADIPSNGSSTRPSSEHLNQTESVESNSLLGNSQPQASDVSALHLQTITQSEASESDLSAPAQILPGSSFSDSQLTDEQIDFVRSLWNANVPAADIARVIERMKSRVSGDGLRSGSGGAPPSYDSLRR